MAFEPLIGKQATSYANSDARLNIWHGSVRSSKTVTSIYRWLNYVNLEAPPGDLLMTGKTLTTLKRNILTPMSEITGEDYTLGGKEIQILGRRVQIEGANDERSEGKVRGMTIAGHYGDELTLWPESYFKMGLSRMSVEESKFFGTTNPDSPYHWLKKDYLDRESELNLKSFHFQLEDNPYISQSFVNDLKKEYTGLWHRRFINGAWVIAEGAIYDMFLDDNSAESHVVNSDDIPWDNLIRYWIGIDYGTTNPTVFLLLGQAKDGTIYILREYRWDSKAKGKQKSDEEQAQAFLDWAGKVAYKNIYLDPSAVSFGLALQNKGVKRVVKADNTVLDGIRNVSTLLSAGLLKINRDCEGLIKEMSSYSWDTKAEEKGEDKPIKKDDHGPDALRYPVRMIFPTYCKPYLRAA